MKLAWSLFPQRRTFSFTAISVAKGLLVYADKVIGDPNGTVLPSDEAAVGCSSNKGEGLPNCTGRTCRTGAILRWSAEQSPFSLAVGDRLTYSPSF